MTSRSVIVDPAISLFLMQEVVGTGVHGARDAVGRVSELWPRAAGCPLRREPGIWFLAPDSGGADVFLHINDIDIDEGLLKPGAKVSFDVEDTGPRVQGHQRGGDRTGRRRRWVPAPIVARIGTRWWSSRQ